MNMLRKLRDRLYVARSRSVPKALSDAESAYFYTFHKCASSLFSSYVLRNISGLAQVDYERQYYAGQVSSGDDDKLGFSSVGHIYGPIRLSAGANSPAARVLTQTATEEFVKDKIALFLIRDPRDILVSRFFSFGFSHSQSSVPEIAVRQRAQRERFLALGVDGYAKKFAPTVRQNFELAARLSDACDRHVVLKFEDMVGDFDRFKADFTRYIDVSEPVLKEIFDRTRPPENEDVSSHKRSGKAGGYKTKLASETVDTINVELAGVLDHFGYDRQTTPSD